MPPRSHGEQEAKCRYGADDERNPESILVLMKLETVPVFTTRGILRSPEERRKLAHMVHVILPCVMPQPPNKHAIQHALAKRAELRVVRDTTMASSSLLKEPHGHALASKSQAIKNQYETWSRANPANCGHAYPRMQSVSFDYRFSP